MPKYIVMSPSEPQLASGAYVASVPVVGLTHGMHDFTTTVRSPIVLLVLATAFNCNPAALLLLAQLTNHCHLGSVEM